MRSRSKGGTKARTGILQGMGAAFTLTLALASPQPAHAQDIAAAEALFNKGVAEIKTGNYAVACPAIAESQKLDPRPGTQYTLAECLARWGKTASAYVAFEDFLRSVKGLPANQQGRYADRVKISEDKKKELSAVIPDLKIVLPKGAPADVKIRRDNTEITGPMLGLSLPLDPGKHKIIVEVPDKPPSEQEITIEPSEHRTLEVSVPGMKNDEASSNDSPGKPGQGRAIATYAALGLGAAGVVVGGITGGLALGDKTTADKQCPKFTCNAQGFEAVERGRTMALVSTVGFAVGGAALATGVILFLTRPKQTPPPVSADVAIGSTGFALTVKGVWQ